MFKTTRRRFLQAAAISAATARISPYLEAVGLGAVAGVAARAAQSVEAGEQFIRLDGGWEFHKGTAGESAQKFPPVGEVKWEPTSWKPIELPHCFNALDACDPDTTYFRGPGWYRTRLKIKNPFRDGRTLLHFQGAGQTTSLWIGSKLVGKHIGGYDEFAFDITEAIAHLSDSDRVSGVPVVVLCDNSPDRDRLPSDLSDFCLYGGLYRHVNLVYLPAVALDTVHILPSLQPDGTAQVSVSARLYDPMDRRDGCEVAIEIKNSCGTVIHRSVRKLPAWKDFTQLDQFAVTKPDLWSPSSPSLYQCRVTLTTRAGEMQIGERFGIRRAEFEAHGPFKLNGQRLFLRGTQRHQDHAGVAAGMSDEQVREELRMIKEMGANFLRLAHYQQDRLVLDLCDELGLLVWEELPWCRSGVGGPAFQQNAADMLTHMIEQHYNHPSVVFWGLGNEDDWPGEYPNMDHESIRSFMSKMNDLAHRLDGSRMTALRRCDFARNIPDVYSPSIWAGWYSGNYHEYEQSLIEQRNRVSRFIHIEWGADSHAGRHAEDADEVLQHIATGQGTDERGLAYLKTGGEPRVSSDGDWSETYACHLIDWYLKTQEKLDWFSGSAQWVFKDFTSPLRGDNGIPCINQKGVVERDLRKKESYFVFQSYWAEKPMVHIYGHSWPVRWGKKGQLRSVLAYSNCDRAELFLNGVSQGERVRDSQNFPAAGLHWDVAFFPGRNHLRVEAHKAGATVSDEIGLTYETEPWGKPAQLKLAAIAHDGDRVTVETKLFDEKGRVCLDARQAVRFSLTGNGRLIDNLGTVRGSRVVQLANGRAEISLHTKDGCSIGAAIEGLATTRLEVRS